MTIAWHDTPSPEHPIKVAGVDGREVQYLSIDDARVHLEGYYPDGDLAVEHILDGATLRTAFALYSLVSNAES